MNATVLLLVVLLPIVVALLAIAPLRASLPRVLKQPAFIGAMILLAVAAIGLNTATEAMKLHFKKQPLDLSVSRLDDLKEGIPARLGNWVQVSKDEPLNHQIQEVLGTKEFVFRDYVDSRVISRDVIEQFTDKPVDERNKRLSAIQQQHPEAVVRLAITYYTGMVDTVPHVPEKCYIADGFEPAGDVATHTQALGEYPDGRPREVSYRYIHFEDTTGNGRVDRSVAYLFHVNGRYESSNIAVRTELANLLQRYGYFAKVELMTQARSKAGSSAGEKTLAQEKSLAAFNDLLGSALPEVERCLPDWNKVAKR